MSDKERTGFIVFVSAFDYISDFEGQEWRGCMATIEHDDGETLLYTSSPRLQQSLETAYIAKARVTVSFMTASIASPFLSQESQEVQKWLSLARKKAGGSEGPFPLRSMWTLL